MEKNRMRVDRSNSRWSAMKGILFLLIGALLVVDGSAAQVTLVEASKVLDTAEAELKAAKLAQAERLAPEEFKAAKKAFEKARTAIYAAKYKKGMGLAEKAVGLAGKAKAKALRVSPPTIQAANGAGQGKEHPRAKTVTGSVSSEKQPQTARKADSGKAPESGRQPADDAKKDGKKH